MTSVDYGKSKYSVLVIITSHMSLCPQLQEEAYVNANEITTFHVETKHEMSNILSNGNILYHCLDDLFYN